MLAKIKSTYVKLLTALTLLMFVPITSSIASGVTQPAFGSTKVQGQYAGGATAKSVSTNATSVMEIFWIVMCSGATVVGLIFAGSGLMTLKKSQDPSSGVQSSTGWKNISIGACLVVLPWILYTAANIITGTST